MNTQTVDILSTLHNQGLGKTLSPHASSILNEIKDSRIVSTTELVNLIEPHSRKGLVFTVAIKILTNVFSKYDISIVYAPSSTKLRVIPTQPLLPSLPKEKVGKKHQLKLHRATTTRSPEEGLSKFVTTLTGQDKFTLTVVEPNKESLPRGDIDTAVLDNIWYDHALDTSIDLVSLYLKEIGKYKLLKPSEELALITLAQQGDVKAREKFLHANLRLVVWNARKFLGRIERVPSMDLSDLIQEGNRGLIKALGKYEPSKGFKFSTYATWWIRSFIDRSINDESRSVRLPVHMVEKIRKYTRVYNMLLHTYGEFVPLEKIAEEMQIGIDEVHTLRRIIAQGFVSVDGYKQNIEDDKPSFFIKDPNKTGDQVLQEKQIKSILRKALKKGLNPREYDIYSLRFGLDQNEQHTLEAVGKKLNVTRERIRQIEKKALEKIQYDPELIKLAKSMNFKVQTSTIEAAEELIKAKQIRESLNIMGEFAIKENPGLADYIADPFALTKEEKMIQKKDIVNIAGGAAKLLKQVLRLQVDEKEKALFKTYYGLGGNINTTQEINLNLVSLALKVTIQQASNTIFKIWKKLVEIGCPITSSAILREMEYLKSEDKSLFSNYTASTVSVIKLVKIVADYYDVNEAEIYADSTLQVIVKPRHVAMYCLKRICNLSFKEIGARLGGKDSLTVRNACVKIETLIKKDTILSQEIQELEKKLK